MTKLLSLSLVVLLFASVALPQKGLGRTGDLSFRRIWSGSLVPQGGVSISHDGRRAAFIQNGNVVTRHLSTGVARHLTSLKFENRPRGVPVWSADDKQLAYSDVQGQIVVLNSNGSSPRAIFRSNQEPAWPVGWAPDGLRILAVSSSPQRESARLFWISTVDRSTKTIQPRSAPYADAYLSHDGRYILFPARAVGGSGENKRVISLIGEDSSGENIISSEPDEYPAGWTPDGKYVLTLRGAALWAIPVSQGKRQGAPMLIHRNLGTAFHGISNVSVLGLTHIGTLYYRTVTSTSDIFTASLDAVNGKVTSQPTPLPLPRTGFNVLPRWSPDGLQILYHWVEWAPSENFVYVLESGENRRVASNVPGAAICWAERGHSIMMIPFVGGSAIYNGLTRVDLNSGEPTALSRTEESIFPASCAVDLVVLNKQFGVVVRRASTGVETEAFHFSQPTVTMPSLSHDGRSVALVSAVAPGITALFSAPTSGGQPRELIRLKSPAEFQQIYFGFTWSPDDKFIYFLKRADDKSPFGLFRVPAEGGPETSSGLALSDMRDIDISPDGSHIAFSVGAVSRPEVWATDNFLPVSSNVRTSQTQKGKQQP